MKNVLEMLFKTGAGKGFKITLDDPREEMTPAEIEAAMNLVILKNPFNVEGGIVEIVGASVITTETQPISFA